MPEIHSVDDVLGGNGLLSEYMPGYKQRDGQIMMAREIMNSYSERRTILINAPTGNGKSIGGLVPAILCKNYGMTIVSTATKALQTQYAEKDLPMLHNAFGQAGINFKSHVLKGRENYCCKARFKNYPFDSSLFKTDFDVSFYNDVLVPWEQQTILGDFEEVPVAVPPTLKSCVCSSSETCDPDCKVKDCYYKRNKAMASEADVLVVNHDLLALSFALREKHGISILPDAYGLIIDEAHKFEDIMTKYLGFRISKFVFRNFSSLVLGYMKKMSAYVQKREFDNLREELSRLCSSIEGASNEFFTNFERSDDKEEPYRIHTDIIDDDVIRMGSRIISLMNIAHERVPSNSAYGIQDKKASQMYQSIVSRCNDAIEKIGMIINMGQYADTTVFWVEFSKATVYLNSAPITIADYSSEWIFTRSTDDVFNNEYQSEHRGKYEYGCVTLMSATLTTNKSFAFIKNRLGINRYRKGTTDVCLRELIIPEVFDYRHQCLLYVPKGIIDPPVSNYDKQVFTRQICQTVNAMSEIVDGGILALFTSYSEMEKVYGLTSGNIQRTSINQKMFNRGKLTQMFRDERDSILYATSSFWEGVDIQGESLSCVIIDRLPFAVPSDPVIEARIEYIKRHGGDWFNDYYLPMMIVALQQGFGRLIRTKDDLGVVVIMDNRLLSKPYGRKILNSLPDCLQTRKLEKVETFFEIVRLKRRIRNKEGKTNG